MKNISRQTKIIIVIVLLIGALAAYMTSEAIKYKNEPKAIVSATISAMEEYSRSNDGHTERGYDLFVDYEYDGKTYEHISYTSVSLSTELSIGDTLELEVYVRNPASIAQDAQGFAVYTWALFAAGIAFAAVRVKNDIKIAEKNKDW